jgi:hypothetical protein
MTTKELAKAVERFAKEHQTIRVCTAKDLIQDT